MPPFHLCRANLISPHAYSCFLDKVSDLRYSKLARKAEPPLNSFPRPWVSRVAVEMIASRGLHTYEKTLSLCIAHRVPLFFYRALLDRRVGPSRLHAQAPFRFHIASTNMLQTKTNDDIWAPTKSSDNKGSGPEPLVARLMYSLRVLRL